MAEWLPFLATMVIKLYNSFEKNPFYKEHSQNFHNFKCHKTALVISENVYSFKIVLPYDPRAARLTQAIQPKLTGYKNAKPGIYKGLKQKLLTWNVHITVKNSLLLMIRTANWS